MPAAAALLRASAPRASRAPAAAAAAAATAAAPPADDLAAPADWAPTGDEQKVERLLLDIDESIKKAGSDAELAYVTLLTYDQRLDSSVSGEIATLGKELTKLKDMQDGYKKRAADLGNVAAGSKQDADESASSVGHLSAGLDNGTSTKRGLDRPEAIRVLTGYMEHGNVSKVSLSHAEQMIPKQQLLVQAMMLFRHLLLEHQVLRPRFPDVYVAFVPRIAMGTALIQKEATKNAKAVKKPLRVRLTPALRKQTIAALKAIQGRLQKGQGQALLQTSATRAAASAEAHSHQLQGIQAEEEKNAQELAFSMTFAEAVLRIDSEFQGKVHESMGKKASLVEEIRSIRQRQHKTLQELVDLLRGRYLADSAVEQKEETEPDLMEKEEQVVVGPGEELVDDVDVPQVEDEETPFALVQVASAGGGAAAGGGQALSLQQEIETALRKKEDTHGILLKVQAMLDREAPVSADGVQQVVNNLGGVLREVEGEQSRAADVRRRCEEQAMHAGKEEQEMKANLALMNTVRNRTKGAIEAAKHNLRSIVDKTKALEASTQEFSNIVTKMVSTLEDQSRDRATIMAAVRKAREIVARRTSAGPAADGLLYQMLQDLQAQDAKEREYRSMEVNSKGAFFSYKQGYLQLLQERRSHYESSLSALELYADEVESDAAAQAETISTDGDLQKQSEDLCAGLMRSYAHHTRQRKELSRMLRTVIPQLPGLSLED